MKDPRLPLVRELYDPPPGTDLWHGGASVLGTLRGVGAQEAAWRPAPGRHTIWELALHVAYWKYAVLRRLVGGGRGGFPRSPSNWPAAPADPTEAAWKADRKLVREYHKALGDALTDMDVARFDEAAGGREKYTFGDLAMGIVMHDTYHAGQIQLMKRLYASRDS